MSLLHVISSATGHADKLVEGATGEVVAPPSPAAAAFGALQNSLDTSYAVVGEASLTLTSLPPPIKDHVGRLMRIYTANDVGTIKSITDDTYERYAVYETNVLACFHRDSLAAWLRGGRGGTLTTVLRGQPSAVRVRLLQPFSGASNEGAVSAGKPSTRLQVEVDMALTYLPLFPLLARALTYMGSYAKTFGLGPFVSQLRVTLTIDPATERVVAHRESWLGWSQLPTFMRVAAGLATPIASTLVGV